MHAARMTIMCLSKGYCAVVLRRAGFAFAMIALGLGLRLYGRGIGLPAGIVKYGGSVLWGAMVLFILAAVLPRLSRDRIAVVAFVVATAVEFFKLVHAPWLDGFRLTLPGALLLGRVFSAWDILAYAMGIAVGAAIDRMIITTRYRSDL